MKEPSIATMAATDCQEAIRSIDHQQRQWISTTMQRRSRPSWHPALLVTKVSRPIDCHHRPMTDKVTDQPPKTSSIALFQPTRKAVRSRLFSLYGGSGANHSTAWKNRHRRKLLDRQQCRGTSSMRWSASESDGCGGDGPSFVFFFQHYDLHKFSREQSK